MEGYDVIAKNLLKTLPKGHNSAAHTLKSTLKTTKLEPGKINQFEQTIRDLEEQVLSLKQLELQRRGSGMFSLEDGVPINPHILALKSQYKAIKSTGDNQIDALNDLIQAEFQRQQEIETSMARLEAKAKDQETENGTRYDFNQKMLETLRVNLFEEREFRAQKERAIQEMQTQLKTKVDENGAFLRRTEKERITDPQKKEADANLVYSLKSQVANKLTEIKALGAELEELTSRIKTNPETKALDNENLNSQTKVLILEKDIANCRIREEEVHMMLNATRIKREQELVQKRELIRIIEGLRKKIEENGKVNDFAILERVVAKERVDVAEAARKLEDLQREKDYVFDALKEEEQRTETAYNERMLLQQEEIDEIEATDKLGKREEELRERLFKIRKQQEAAEVRRAIDDSGLDDLERQVTEWEGRVAGLDKDISQAKCRLDAISQQRELSRQIKGLNLQDLRISKEANLEANENLNRFMRNYQAILETHAKDGKGL